MTDVLNVIRTPDEFCKPCGLYKECNSPIMNGEGSEDPVWFFIGEAPGGEEDEKGFPFIGDAGVLLRESIEEVGIPLDKCRFSNVVRCRPPNNDLKKWPKAIEHCRPHILREIRAVNPKVIVLIGNSATQSIMNKKGILRLHNTVLDIGRAKIVCMFHPAYLMRNNTPATKKLFLDALRTAKHVGLGQSTTKVEKKRNRTVIVDRMMLKEFVDIIKKSEDPATDIESSTLSPYAIPQEPYYTKPTIGCIGVAFSNHDACLFPTQKRNDLKLKIHTEEIWEAIKELWEDPDIRWLTWGKFDFMYTAVIKNIWLGGRGHPTGAYYDGMLGSYVLDERKGIHSLKDWGVRGRMPNYEHAIQQYELQHAEADRNRGGNILLCPKDLLFDYNMDDCILTRRSYFIQRPLLEEQNLWKNPLRFPLMQINWVAAMMEITGMNIDLDANEKLEKIYNRAIEKLDKKLYEYPEIKTLQDQLDERELAKLIKRVKSYKRPVANVKKKVIEMFTRSRKILNLNAPDTRRDLAFKVLDCTPIAMTKGNQPSAAKWILEELQKEKRSPVLGKMIKRGEYASSQSKYIKPVPGWVGSDGRTHTTYKPIGTATGRVSSEDPNHENLPKRYVLAKKLREQFTSTDADHVIVEEDSKQIELRLIAHRAHDVVMIAEFNAGKDPHRMGAAAAYEIPEDEVTDDQRFNAKSAVSFGLVYGRSAAALALDFGWRQSKAERFKERYFGKYYGIKEYLAREHDRIIKKQVVKSYFGRLRRLPEALNEDEGRREAAIREGINSPIQGDASDVNWIAAYRMQRWLLKHKMRTKVIVVVHDAVYLDAHIKELEIVVPKLHFYMSDRDYIHKMTGWYCEVPLDTDCSIGPNLGQMVELKHTKIPGQFIFSTEEKAA